MGAPPHTHHHHHQHRRRDQQYGDSTECEAISIWSGNGRNQAIARITGWETELLLGIQIGRLMYSAPNFWSGEIQVGQCVSGMGTSNLSGRWVFPIVQKACAFKELVNYS